MISVELGSISLKNRQYFCLETRFHQLYILASSGLQKMFIFIIFLVLFGKILFPLILFDGMIIVFVADVNATV